MDFTTEQIAGDLIPDAKPEQRLATAFHRQTLFNREGGVDPEEDRTKRVIDRATTTATTWLGLTMQCTQCHDHPYGPISQREFYEFYAFFNNADETTASVPKYGGDARVVKQRSKNPRPTYIFHRGDFLQPKKDLGAVENAPPTLAHTFEAENADRLDLAEWIVAEDNPLTARVVSNVIWSHLFGEGLAATLDDFGTRAAAPSHLPLLDWLADEFIRLGWSRKQLIRTIMSSRSYRQSSAHRPELAAHDADNRLWHRQNRPRVEAEIVRESAAPELSDLSGESEATKESYGLNRKDPKGGGCGSGGGETYATFGRNCLLARRMAERGVRFVNIVHASWDHHSNLDKDLDFNAGMSDQPVAALIKDLKQRGLLDETLVVWGSEFGRTPLGENRPGRAANTGRDHHPNAFTMFLAGGGVKGGLTYGETDEIGWDPVVDPVHANDFHATLLATFGLDHERLTHRHGGLEHRLTSVTRKSKVIDEWFA